MQMRGTPTSASNLFAIGLKISFKKNLRKTKKLFWRKDWTSCRTWPESAMLRFVKFGEKVGQNGFSQANITFNIYLMNLLNFFFFSSFHLKKTIEGLLAGSSCRLTQMTGTPLTASNLFANGQKIFWTKNPRKTALFWQKEFTTCRWPTWLESEMLSADDALRINRSQRSGSRQ